MKKTLHAEHKIPNGKLVVVDLEVLDDLLHTVSLSGDFFMEPPETIDIINSKLQGLSSKSDSTTIESIVEDILNSGDIMAYGINAAGIATVIQKALA